MTLDSLPKPTPSTTATSTIPIFLAGGVTLGFFSLIGLLVFRSIPPTTHDILLTLIGSLNAAWIGIMGYYFGSSAGSTAKSDTISALIEKK